MPPKWASEAKGWFELMNATDPLARAIGQFTNILLPNALPNPEQIYHAWRCGLMRPGDAEVALLASACKPSVQMSADRAADVARPNDPSWGWAKIWDGVWKSTVEVPGPGELLALLNLQLMGPLDFHKKMQLNGFYEADDRELLVELSRNTPPGADALVSFALREAWDAATVARFQYDAEFPPEFQYWMQRKGADGDARIKVNGVPQGELIGWSKLFWRVHWRTPSPGQAAEMFQRLRPNRIGRYAAQLPGLRAFTFEDYQQILKVQDYAVPFRPQLAALAYKLPRLVDIDRFFKMGTIDRAEVYEMHLDRGYSPADAELRTRWLEQKKMSEPPSGLARDAPKRVLALYNLGKLARTDAHNRLIDLLTGGLFRSTTPAVILESQRPGFNEALRISSAMLSDADLQRDVAITTKLVRALRRQFLTGQINGIMLRDELETMGHVQDWIQQFVAELEAELASGRMLLSTSRVKEMVIDGIMPIRTAQDYLENLGWKGDELRYLMLQLDQDLRLQQAQDAERAATDQGRAAREQQRQARFLERQREEIIRRMNKQASAAQLKRYFVRSIITEDEYDRELERRGFESAARKRAIRDAKIDRAKYIAGRQERRGSTPAGADNSAGGEWGQNGQTPAPQGNSAPPGNSP